MQAAQQASSPTISEDYLRSYLATDEEARSLSVAEQDRFIHLCLTFQLDPLKREIHIRKPSGSSDEPATFLVGYSVYIKKAQLSSLLSGWNSRVLGKDDDLRAEIVIYRKDWSHPFIHEVYFNEVVQTDDNGNALPFWKKMPRFLLRKVAISQGFRMAFPELLSGIPYDQSELPLPRRDDIKLLPHTKPESAPPAKSTSTEKPCSADDIKALVLANQDKLKPVHVTWIFEQLMQEKNARQLKGLYEHVRKSITDSETGQGQSNGSRIRSLQPTRHFPTRQRSQSRLPPAAGAENTIF